MKIHLLSLLALASLLILSACITDANISPPSKPEPQLVLNSWFSPDRPWFLYLSELREEQDSITSWVADARILLYENEVLIDSFLWTREGKYTCSTQAIAGNTYKVHVESVGFPDLWAEEVVPDKVIVEEADYVFSTNEAHVIFTDPANQVNFYEVGPPFSQEPDPVILAEGYASYLAFGNFFADNLIEGQTYTFVAKQNLTFGGGDPDRYFEDCRSVPCYANLRNISENMYLFHKTWIQHGFNLTAYGVFDLPYISEPLNVHSNVSGGLGIFAAYNEDSTLMILR